MFPLFLAQIHFVILNHSHELVSIYIYMVNFFYSLGVVTPDLYTSRTGFHPTDMACRGKTGAPDPLLYGPVCVWTFI